jgi:hypothetical protein
MISGIFLSVIRSNLSSSVYFNQSWLLGPLADAINVTWPTWGQRSSECHGQKCDFHFKMLILQITWHSNRTYTCALHSVQKLYTELGSVPGGGGTSIYRWRVCAYQPSKVGANWFKHTFKKRGSFGTTPEINGGHWV